MHFAGQRTRTLHFSPDPLQYPRISRASSGAPEGSRARVLQLFGGGRDEGPFMLQSNFKKPLQKFRLQTVLLLCNIQVPPAAAQVQPSCIIPASHLVSLHRM